MSEVPFRYVYDTFIVVPVLINGSIHRDFVLDTGIGLNLISKSICQEIGCKTEGQHIGKRMSGQEVTIPMTTIKSLSFGERKLNNVAVGVFDIESLMPKSNIGGFLSLGFFKDSPFTIDYEKRVIRFEDSGALKKIQSEGTRVSVQLDQQGESLGIIMPLVLPNGEKIAAEVDTGSQALILHERYMKPLQILSTDPSVKRKEGKDETGHSYSRFFTNLRGAIHLPNAPKMNSEAPEVMFQKIIYDGLVGHYFFKNFRVTYDLPNLEMIFRRFSTVEEK
jgi:hypothetical protein